MFFGNRLTTLAPVVLVGILVALTFWLDNIAQPAPRGPVLQPEGELRGGESHSSQARLPARAGRPKLENVEMASEFASQVEEVLSREHYPAHYKEFIRSYFLNLSRGERARPGGTQ